MISSAALPMLGGRPEHCEGCELRLGGVPIPTSTPIATSGPIPTPSVLHSVVALA
jgi:hypothetical protein